MSVCTQAPFSFPYCSLHGYPLNPSCLLPNPIGGHHFNHCNNLLSYPRWNCGIFWKDIWIAPPIDPDEVSSLLKKRGSLSARDSVSGYSESSCGIKHVWEVWCCMEELSGRCLSPFYLALRGLCLPPHWQNLEKTLPSNTFTVHWIFFPLYPEAWAQRYFTTSLWKSLESTL